jgi:hypothetical protein
MKWIALVTLLTLGTAAAMPPAEAAGCLKGAAVGGLAGHAVGHGVAGAAVGCAVGHHEANKAAKQAAKPAPGQGNAGQGNGTSQSSQ